MFNRMIISKAKSFASVVFVLAAFWTSSLWATSTEGSCKINTPDCRVLSALYGLVVKCSSSFSDLYQLPCLSFEIISHMYKAHRYLNEDLLHSAELELKKTDSDLRKFIELANINKGHPLEKAEVEIKVVMKMIQARDYEAARQNLQKAKARLETYYGLKEMHNNRVVEKPLKGVNLTIGIVEHNVVNQIISICNVVTNWYANLSTHMGGVFVQEIFRYDRYRQINVRRN